MDAFRRPRAARTSAPFPHPGWAGGAASGSRTAAPSAPSGRPAATAATAATTATAFLLGWRRLIWRAAGAAATASGRAWGSAPVAWAVVRAEMGGEGVPQRSLAEAAAAAAAAAAQTGWQAPPRRGEGACARTSLAK